jgi:hypothetical protein
MLAVTSPFPLDLGCWQPKPLQSCQKLAIQLLRRSQIRLGLTLRADCAVTLVLINRDALALGRQRQLGFLNLYVFGLQQKLRLHLFFFEFSLRRGEFAVLIRRVRDGGVPDVQPLPYHFALGIGFWRLRLLALRHRSYEYFQRLGHFRPPQLQHGNLATT